MGKNKQKEKREYNQKNFQKEVADMLKSCLHEQQTIYHTVQRTDQGVTDIKTRLTSLEKHQDRSNQNQSIFQQKLSKIEKETDSAGKVQGIFDFTFAIITISIAILLIPSEIIWIKDAGYALTGFGLFIFCRLSLALFEKIRKPNIKYYTFAQIILSIFAIILYMVNYYE